MEEDGHLLWSSYTTCVLVAAEVEQEKLTALAQLPHKILRITRHRLHGPEEETPQYVPHMYSRQDGANVSKLSSTLITTARPLSSATLN